MGKNETDMKVLCIIPAYNEAANIGGVIEALNAWDSKMDLLVINDCSTDETGIIAESLGGAAVIHLPVNLGIGGAVQTGFKYALRRGYDIAVKFDGDGQHDAAEIPKLLAPIIDGEADVVIGSRFCRKHDGYRSTPMRRVGIRVFEIVNSLLIGKRITDNTSGFIAFNKSAIAFMDQHYPTDYPEPESVILFSKNGFRIKEVFTKMNARTGGASSIKGMKSIYYMLKVLLAILMTAMRPKMIKE